MRSLLRVGWGSWSLVGAALACGCFSPGGFAESSGATTGPGMSTGAPTSSTTPATGAESTTGTTEVVTSSTGDTTGGVVATTGTTGTTGGSTQTGDADTTGSTGSDTTGGAGLCGDGVLDKGELCDDGNQILDDGCNADCERDALFVFVSSLIVNPGELSTPQKADDICTALGENGGGVPPVARGSKFVAWLSYDGDGGDAIDRVPYSPLPYRATESELRKVFENTDDIAGNATLDESLRFTEAGIEITEDDFPCSNNSVWTGTDEFGMGTTLNCMNWTSVAIDQTATAGRTWTVNGAWANHTQCYCAGALRIYCFESA